MRNESTVVSQSQPASICPTRDPGWLLVEHGLEAGLEHAIESLFAISNGYVGTRANRAEGGILSNPATYIAGVFDRSPVTGIAELAVAPNCKQMRICINGREIQQEELVRLEHCRYLDLKQGLLWREGVFEDEENCRTRFRTLRLASLADRHILFQSVQLTPENFHGPLSIEAQIVPPIPQGDQAALQVDAHHRLPGSPDSMGLLELTTRTGVRVAFAWTTRLWEEDTRTGSRCNLPRRSLKGDTWELPMRLGVSYHLERMIAVHTSRDTDYPAEAAVRHIEQLQAGSITQVIQPHVAAWEKRWQEADICIAGDDALTRKLRFAAYHLIGAANPDDERISIGARMLTGDAYKGHVFWDTEIFMLPFYTFTHPESARSLLKYRYHTLEAAREKARKLGFAGALYAWESADTGEETTPTAVTAPTGEVIRILCGTHEHHISADVAYAVWQYWQATGDNQFLLEAGAEILLETARFWGSRGQFEADGKYHIRQVIGPDEYHEEVDDNAFTNGMAKWNLLQATKVADFIQECWPGHWRELAGRLNLTQEEIEGWRETARQMYRAQDAQSGLLEQFEGYFGLEEIDLAAYPDRQVPMDVILGQPRTRQTKVIKQADVIMLLHLLWEHFPDKARASNYRYYEQRCGHGSSLSPSMHALVAARLGKIDAAVHYFRQAAEIDLANNMGNASGGVHAAALGGLWQAAVFGFAGLSITATGLSFNPHCPEEWQALDFPLQWRGALLRVRVTPDSLQVKVEAGVSACLSVGGTRPVRLGKNETARWAQRDGAWHLAQGTVH